MLTRPVKFRTAANQNNNEIQAMMQYFMFCVCTSNISVYWIFQWCWLGHPDRECTAECWMNVRGCGGYLEWYLWPMKELAEVFSQCWRCVTFLQHLLNCAVNPVLVHVLDYTIIDLLVTFTGELMNNTHWPASAVETLFGHVLLWWRNIYKARRLNHGKQYFPLFL